MSATGIPQSDLLQEASADSLAEVIARDPESWQQRDLETIVAGLREQRAKWEAVDAASSKRERTKQPKMTTTSASAEDLGL